MRIPGSRTVSKAAKALHTALYHGLKMDRVPEEKHRLDLAVAMGFDGQWDNHRSFQMDFLHRNGMTAESRFLEIGSGPLTLGIPLMKALDPGHYTGVDVRESVANLAYTEVARAGLAGRNPRLLVCDDFGAAALGDEIFDFIWSFSVLFHLSDDLLEMWFENVGKRLAPDGRYWANINVHVDESRWLEFPFHKRQTDFYETIAAQHGLTMTLLGSLEDLGFRGHGSERLNLMLEFRRA